MTARKPVPARVIDAIQRIMRNGRIRHAGEIREALERDYRLKLHPNTLGKLLRKMPDIEHVGRLQTSERRGRGMTGATYSVWRRVDQDEERA